MAGMLLCVASVSAAVTITPEGDKYVGDVLSLDGTTVFSPGNRILVTIEQLSFGPTNKSASPGIGGMSGQVTVEGGGGGANRWYMTVDTASYPPGDYLVTAEVLETDVVETATFTLLPRRVTLPETGTPAVTGPATVSPLTESPLPTATQAGGAAWAVCAGLLVVSAYLRQRRPR
ncbi:MAG: hypothetical protein JXA08_02990 [Methanomicrobiaceae archaeon]|nr:hypothetical protein [Methanomicrobiaceae archaeon]